VEESPDESLLVESVAGDFHLPLDTHALEEAQELLLGGCSGLRKHISLEVVHLVAGQLDGDLREAEHSHTLEKRLHFDSIIKI
jgi:hypothetical protein